MRKLILVALLAVAAVSCEKGNLGVVTFDVTQDGTFTYPPNNGILDLLSITTPAIKSTWKGQFENNNTDADKLQEMKLKTSELTITAPGGQTWKFLKSMEIWIKAEGLQETKVAFNNNIDENVGQTLVLTPIDVDLKPFAQKDEFELTIKTQARETTSEKIEGNIHMVFKVKADVID
jgi:hypothetical protein